MNTAKNENILIIIFSVFFSILIAFSRILDSISFWIHGILLICFSIVIYISLRSHLSLRLPLTGALVVGMLCFGLLNGMARGFGLVDVFRDATPLFALVSGLLLMNISADRVLPFLRLHLIITGVLMAVQVFLRFAIHPTATPLDLYFYRAELPLYASFMPVAALLLWLGGGWAGRLTAALLMVATALTLGRVEYGVIAFALILLVLSMPWARNPLISPLLLLGTATGAVGAMSMLGEAVGALSRLSFDLNDPSLGWRMIEVGAFLDWWNQAGIIARIIGDGLGSAIRLPGALRDFAGNPTIPILHISPLTWVLKFGLFGVLFLVVLLIWIAFSQRCWRSFGLPLTWLIVGSVVIRGIAQHGLYEPWPLFLLGVLIGSMWPGFAASSGQSIGHPAINE